MTRAHAHLYKADVMRLASIDLLGVGVIMSIVLKIQSKENARILVEKEVDAISIYKVPFDFVTRYKAKEVGTDDWYFFRKCDNKTVKLPMPRDFSSAKNGVVSV